MRTSFSKSASAASREDVLQHIARRGELTIFGGRPSMGRTSVALNIALALQETRGGTALYFDLDRMWSNVERRLRSIVGEFEEPQLLYERTTPPTLPLRLWEAAMAEIEDIAAVCREAAKRGPVAGIVIDWVQLLFGLDPNAFDAYKNARDLVSLRELARNLDVPVIALSNLPRELEERDDKRPRLSDFTAIGLPPGACDRFTALYRPLYYQAEVSEPGDQNADILVWETEEAPPKTLVVDFDARSGRVTWR